MEKRVLWLDVILLCVGCVAVYSVSPFAIEGDGIARFEALSRLLADGSFSRTPYSLIGPLASAPLWLLGTATSAPEWWTARFNFVFFVLCLGGLYRALTPEIDRRTTVRFLLLLTLASMFPHHLGRYYSEVFTALAITLGLALVAVKGVYRGWLLAETQGVYNDALVIITADHGVSFQHGLPRRAARDGTRADVMLVPLIVKYPGQVAGLISDQNVETVDIVPTIAEVLSTTVPYDVDGRSVLDVTKPERVDKSYVHRNATNAIIQKHEPMLGDRYAGLREKLLRFESGLYALGPHALLVGRPLSSLDVRTSTKSAIRLEDPLVFDNVDLDGDRLPLFVRGAMTEVAENHVSIAIAVNGTVVATTQSYLEHDQWVFASMIPEEVLLSGDNDLRVFVVSVTSEGTVLTLATSTS